MNYYLQEIKNRLVELWENDIVKIVLLFFIAVVVLAMTVGPVEYQSTSDANDQLIMHNTFRVLKIYYNAA